MTTVVGVDLGENVLYATAVVSGETVEEVQMESAREIRHYRERLEQRRKSLSEQGELVGVRATKDDRRRYTEQETHTATRESIELAADYAPCLIRIEGLSDYRESAEDAIHDWPYPMLTKQIACEAREAKIPVPRGDPSNTSITCRQCGETNTTREGTDLECWECGYEVHADVNAVINITNGGVG